MPSAPRRNLRTALVPRLAGLLTLAPAPLLMAARPALASLLGCVPGWRAQVGRGMAAALAPEPPDPAAARAYFRHLADLFVFSTLVYRSGGIGAPWLAAALEQDTDCLEHFRRALAAGRGALMVCPHLIGHEIMAGAAARDLPVTVLVRKSPHPEYEAVKQRWYAALGLEVVQRPARGADPQGLGEMTAALRALRKNRILAITPDLLQRPGSGIPVRLFGREASLPAGAFFLSARLGAPLVPAFFHHTGERYRLWAHAPLQADPDLDRDAALARLAQQWASLFEEFVRAHPDMWQFWLDRRWAKWLAE